MTKNILFAIICIYGFALNAEAVTPKKHVWHEVVAGGKFLAVTIPDCWVISPDSDVPHFSLTSEYPCDVVKAPDIDVSISNLGSDVHEDYANKIRNAIITSTDTSIVDHDCMKPFFVNGVPASRGCASPDSTLLETSLGCGRRIAKISVDLRPMKFDGRKSFKVSGIKNPDLRRIFESIRCVDEVK